MPAPVSTTSNTAGNLLASTTVAASATTTFDVDYSAKIGGTIQISATFGTISATSGIQIDVFRRVGSGPGIDTQSALPAIVAATASTTQVRSIALGTGRYRVRLTNLDATNSVTSVTGTDDTINSYS